MAITLKVLYFDMGDYPSQEVHKVLYLFALSKYNKASIDT